MPILKAFLGVFIMIYKKKALHTIIRTLLITSITLMSGLCFGNVQKINGEILSQENTINVSDCTKINTPLAKTRENTELSYSDQKTSFFNAHQEVLVKTLVSAFTITFISIISKNSPTTKTAFLNQLKPLNFLKNLCFNYTKSFLGTLGHESGHALAAHYLTNSPINIHIGKNSTDTTENSLKLSNISLYSINPTIGYSIYTPPINNNKKKIAIAIAGGLTGLLVNYCFKLITGYLTGSSDSSIFIKAITPDYLDIQQLFTLLIPDGMCGYGETDSIRIYSSLGVSEEALNNISKFEPRLFADIFANLGLEFALSSSTSNPIELVALTALNMATLGFLRFNLQ